MQLKRGRKRLGGYFWLLLCWCFLMFSGCSHDKHDHPDLRTGKQLFDYHCAECHKKTGKGQFLKGIPANKGTALSAGQVSHKVKFNDGAQSKMPSFPEMSNFEAQKIASYLKKL